MHRPVKSCIAVAALLLSILPGCSSGDGFERIGVSGDVTHRGEPVVQGQIRFVPQPGTMAPLVVEAIRDGRYATTTTGVYPLGHSGSRYAVSTRTHHRKKIHWIHRHDNCYQTNLTRTPSSKPFSNRAIPTG